MAWTQDGEATRQALAVITAVTDGGIDTDHVRAAVRRALTEADPDALVLVLGGLAAGMLQSLADAATPAVDPDVLLQQFAAAVHRHLEG